MFLNSSVIKLTDEDFLSKSLPKGKKVVVNNAKFRGKNGYIMIYASWCPHCRAKEDFWSYLADQFNNSKSKYYNENFRIGVIDCQDARSAKICKDLEVGPIPRFLHVIPNKKNPDLGDLIDYQGSDLSPESLIKEVCDLSSADDMCNFDSSELKPPKFNYN